MKVLYAAGLSLTLLSGPALAEDKTLYCIVEHMVGLMLTEDTWGPVYDDVSIGKRYAIRFSNDYATVSGVESTKTPYHCKRQFPNKAPDVLTCINSRVATMVFNYSTQTGRFVLTMTSPSGWLSIGTDRAELRDRKSDYLVLGSCQAF